MPTGTWDASVKQLCFADDGTLFTADTITTGGPYDVIADIEIGAELNGFANAHRLIVTVTNLTTNQVIGTQTLAIPLTPTHDVRREQLRADFPSLAANTANDGDLLVARCSYKVTAGVHTDIAHATSDLAIATT
ncbi:MULTISPECIES: hypothetical protein [unclassified Streptomyces]|uniref:hypothetical protein n=1 Tax=unclassified Streptomyces TaxID=2593676 RepID=UPI0013A6F113|nr:MULTISPECIES: hypothetical protein [unclassified Streptomyces]